MYDIQQAVKNKQAGAALLSWKQALELGLSLPTTTYNNILYLLTGLELWDIHTRQLVPSPYPSTIAGQHQAAGASPADAASGSAAAAAAAEVAGASIPGAAAAAAAEQPAAASTTAAPQSLPSEPFPIAPLPKPPLPQPSTSKAPADGGTAREAGSAPAEPPAAQSTEVINPAAMQEYLMEANNVWQYMQQRGSNQVDEVTYTQLARLAALRGDLDRSLEVCQVSGAFTLI